MIGADDLDVAEEMHPAAKLANRNVGEGCEQSSGSIAVRAARDAEQVAAHGELLL